MEFRINLNDYFLPVQIFFNAIPGKRFLEVMGNISERRPYGFDACLMELPEDIDDGETPFVGVKFSLPTEEVVITNEDFIKYAHIACQAHLQVHPEDNLRVSEILNRIKQNFPA